MAEIKVETVPNTAIGIDLGTTFARVAVWQNGKVTVIANERGNKMTPNCVGFSNTTRMFGEAAKKQASVNHKNTIIAGKRLLGCSISGKEVREALNFQGFQVDSHGGQPKLNVQFNGGPKTFAPEEISAMMLIKMKEIAEVHLGTTVKEAVITVPSCFNQFQRQATLNAGAIAGLNILRILNEPTAAALAYELDKDFIDIETKKNVLFFCMGGGSTSVSVISIDNGSSFEVIATAGDTHLGGEDFDNKLVTYCINEVERKHKKKLDSGSKAIFRLKIACEKAKRSLSSCNETSIVVDSLHEDIDFVLDLTRARFEEICYDLFQSARKCVENVLKDSKRKKTKIDCVVFVGGSTKIPKMQLLPQDFRNLKELIKSQGMEESVVFGAAVQAAILSGSSNAAIPKVNVVDVTPFSLALVNHTAVGQTVIPRNSKIPVSATHCCPTSFDNQHSMEFRIAELMLTEMTTVTVGIFKTEVPPAPARVSNATCAFSLDANGVLHTFRSHDTTNREEMVNMIPGSHMSKEEIVQMTTEALSYKEKEDRDKELTMLGNQLEAYITSVKQALSEVAAKAAAKYTEVISLLDNKPTNKLSVLLMRDKIRNELMPLLKKSNACFAAGEVLGQKRDTRKDAQPDSTQRNGEPTAKKSRQTAGTSRPT